MKHTESDIQKACVRLIRTHFKKYSPFLLKVGNGGKRTKIAAIRSLAEGELPGAADLFLAYPSPYIKKLMDSGSWIMLRDKGFCGLWIEMKSKAGVQSEKQKEFQMNMESVGYKYVIVRSIDEFLHEMTVYLNL